MAYQKRQFPKSFPAAGTLFGKDVTYADAAALRGYISNKDRLDRNEALGLITLNGGTLTVTTETLKGLLREGETWYELLPDGLERICSACGQRFQPVIIPWKNESTGEEGIGGNFFVRKTIEVDKYLEVFHDEDYATEYRAQHDALTAEALGVADLPGTVRVAVACKNCRERLLKTSRVRFMAFDSLADAIRRAADGIARAMSVTAFVQSSTRKRDNNHTSNRDDRANWNGLWLFPGAAAHLSRLVREGKIENSIEGLLTHSAEELEAMGLRGAEKILGIARQVTQNRSGGRSMTAQLGQVAERNANDRRQNNRR